MRYILASLVALYAAPAAGQTNYPPGITAEAQAAIDAAASKAEAAKTAADAATAAAASTVKTVNGTTPTNGNIALPIPTPATTMPPGVTDSGAIGTQTTIYALANHTHASKARKTIVDTAADGSVTWTFATPFTTGTIPICAAVAQVATGVTDVVNVQIVDAPSATSVKLLVNRANRSVAALLGLTVLSIPSTPGVTRVHAICLEP